MKNVKIEFELDTPVFVTDDLSGQPLGGDIVIRNTIEEAVLADAVGIDSVNIGTTALTSWTRPGAAMPPESWPHYPGTL